MRKTGFVLLELLIAISIIASFAVGVSYIISTINKSKQHQETRNLLNAIDQTIKNVMVTNAQYAENNCVGFADTNCQNILLTPQVQNGNLVFYTQNEESLAPISNYCGLVSKDGNKHEFECFDGFGKKIAFEVINGQILGSDYIAPYDGKILKIIAHTSLYDKEFTYTDVIDYLTSKTLQKEIDISNAIKKFVRTINLKEYANDCSDGNTTDNPANGLGSWDDAMVPWIWRMVSQDTSKLCTGSDDGKKDSCGCKLFQDDSQYWETNAYYCIINSKDTWQRVLNNLGLGTNYRTDGFGNVLTISMLSDSNGEPTDCPPKAPQVGYYYSPTFPKVRIGIVTNCTKSVTGNSFNGTCDWYSYIDVYTE